MLRTLPFFILIFLLGCNYSPSHKNQKKVIVLDNNLGNLIIYPTEKFDTLYSWISQNDIRCGTRKIFKITNKQSSLEEHSGFYSKFTADSIYEITISQPAHVDCKDSSRIIDREYLNQKVTMRKTTNPEKPFEKIEIRKIDERDFLVFACKTEKDNLDISNIQAETLLEGYLIKISFTCVANDCEDFIFNMEKFLDKIEFTDNN